MTIRTINKAYEELKARDPETSITKNLLREMVKQEIIPSVRAGNRYLVDVDVIEQFFENTTQGSVSSVTIRCS